MSIKHHLSLIGCILSVTFGIAYCKCNYTINVPPNGTIYSPRYPTSYENNINCTWKIKSYPGTKVTLRIEDLDIEADDPALCGPKTRFRPCCKHNWVSVPVANGARLKSQLLCGSRVPPGIREFQIVAPEVTVKMHISKIIKGGRGFSMSVTTEKPDCLVPGMVPCGTTLEDGCYNNMTERCNGIEDCHSKQDELGCHIACASGVGQFLLSQKCDGNPDCSDFSDEIDCGSCGERKAFCSPGSNHCFVPALERCDGRFDCPQGEDEAGCLPECNGRIACSSGEGCYSPWQLCDGLSDCSDGSDEVQCPQALCLPLQDRRMCHNGRCLPAALWCDGTDDCGDNSDEATCLKNSVITLAIIGCLLSGLMLVIAVSCALRMYGHRFHSPANYRLHISSHQRLPSSVSLPALLDNEFFQREPPPAYSVAMGQSPARPRRHRRPRPRSVLPPQVVMKPPDYSEIGSSSTSHDRSPTIPGDSSPTTRDRSSISPSSGTDDSNLLSS